MKTSIAAILAAGIMLATVGCGAGTVTAARYSTVRQVIAALDHGGMRCTGAEYSNPRLSRELPRRLRASSMA